MSDLAALQRRFMASVMRTSDEVRGELRAEGGIDIELGLGIYSHAYQARLREVLGNDHALLANYLGDALWDELCVAYIAAHPSGHRSLRNFGDALPEFLQRHATFMPHAVISELAAFERSLLDCFDAPDAALAEWAQLQDLPAAQWPGLRLRLSPSVRWFLTSTNAVTIWMALKAGQVPPPAVLLVSGWLCWRDAALVTRFRSLEAEEAALLDHFVAGGEFAGACELLLGWHAPDDVPVRAVGFLAQWAEEGLVSGWMADGRNHPALPGE